MFSSAAVGSGSAVGGPETVGRLLGDLIRRFAPDELILVPILGTVAGRPRCIELVSGQVMRQPEARAESSILPPKEVAWCGRCPFAAASRWGTAPLDAKGNGGEVVLARGAGVVVGLLLDEARSLSVVADPGRGSQPSTGTRGPPPRGRQALRPTLPPHRGQARHGPARSTQRAWLDTAYPGRLRQ